MHMNLLQNDAEYNQQVKYTIQQLRIIKFKYDHKQTEKEKVTDEKKEEMIDLVNTQNMNDNRMENASTDSPIPSANNSTSSPAIINEAGPESTAIPSPSTNNHDGNNSVSEIAGATRTAVNPMIDEDSINVVPESVDF